MIVMKIMNNYLSKCKLLNNIYYNLSHSCQKQKDNLFKLSVKKRTQSLLQLWEQAKEFLESMDHPLMSLNPLPWESKSWSLFFFWDCTDSKTWTLELESEDLAMLPRSTPSDRPLQRELSPITKSMSTRQKKDKLRRLFFNTTEACWWLIQEDASQRSTVVPVPEPESRNPTDEDIYQYYISLIHKLISRIENAKYCLSENSPFFKFLSLIIIYCLCSKYMLFWQRSNKLMHVKMKSCINHYFSLFWSLLFLFFCIFLLLYGFFCDSWIVLKYSLLCL